MSRNPRELGYDEAAALLLPRRYGMGSPNIRPWDPWTRPFDHKQIDDEVAKQIERTARGRAPHMRTRAQLDAIRIPCPYAHARLATALAAEDGKSDLLTIQAAKSTPASKGYPAQLATYADAADELAKQIDAFLGQDLNWGLGLTHRSAIARADLNEDNARLRRVHAAQDQVAAAPEALRVLAATARENKKQLTPSGSPGDPWRQAFVMRVGIAWRSLTGQNPAPTSAHFARFVAAGYNSLDPGVPTDALEWRHYIATACERMTKRPEWDRWDREERDTLPPGTTIITVADYQERQRQREERFTADVHALLDAVTPEEERDARMKLLADWSWFAESERGRRDLARIQAARGLKH